MDETKQTEQQATDRSKFNVRLVQEHAAVDKPKHESRDSQQQSREHHHSNATYDTHSTDISHKEPDRHGYPEWFVDDREYLDLLTRHRKELDEIKNKHESEKHRLYQEKLMIQSSSNIITRDRYIINKLLLVSDWFILSILYRDGCLKLAEFYHFLKLKSLIIMETVFLRMSICSV